MPSLPQNAIAGDAKFELRVNEFLAADSLCLFNEERFFRLHSSSRNDVYAQLVRRSDTRVLATFACFDDGGGAYWSPKRGTFGSISARSGLDPALVEQILSGVIDRLISQGAASLSIKCPPWSHDPSLAAITANVLSRLGATLYRCELNYDLSVDQREFGLRLDAGNRKRIRKCREQGFIATEVGTQEHGRVYELIRDNRLRRGYPMTMSSPQLAELALAFPGRVRYFGVYRDNSLAALVAGAVCIAVSQEVFYVFYWGDGPDMQAHSPVALLASEIYGFCQTHGYKILDVGISTVDGEPNPGLIAFKRGLGFSESLKPTYVLHLKP